MPGLEEARRIAEALRCNWGVAEGGKLDLGEMLDRTGVELVLGDLGSAEGGPQGLLTPLSYGGYRIEVDPAPPLGWGALSQTLREEIRRHRTRFVAVHEIAHTLFYWHGRGGPERLLGDSEEQERFCDALAAALLVPPATAAEMALRPESVVELHKRFDVSIEVAARALVDAHGDGVAWLMIVPEDESEPWVQWGAARSSEAVGPWSLLSRLAAKVRQSGTVAEGRLRWRSGRQTLARGRFLAERRQLVVTARAG
ncbi:MAG: ImmA/IrrE family metallo-endopeptidase [Solirubrobacterales bacterium]